MSALHQMSFRPSGNGSLRLTLADRAAVVRRLEVSAECPPYFRSLGVADSKRTADESTFFVQSGTFEVTALRATWYALLTPAGASELTESQALLSLGAFEKLVALGLEDAAVSLMANELLYARNQWVRWRYG